MNRPHRALALLLAFAASLASCATLPSDLDTDSEYLVAVKCARLPPNMPWVSRFAEHGWFDIKRGTQWTRVEILNRNTGVIVRSILDATARSDIRFESRQVHVIASYSGADAKLMGEQILTEARSFPHADNYSPWPGPNSNTFVEWLSHRVPGLWIEQYPTAVGKDYPMNGWIDAGVTTTRTGVELETPILGAQLGLLEGVELHLLGLTIGVDLWPPQLKLPFLPGLPWGLAY